MHLLIREIRASDFDVMVRICQPAPTVQVDDLKIEWSVLFNSQAYFGVVLEDLDLPQGTRELGMMAMVFITDEFFEFARKAKEPFLMRHLVSAALNGRSPFVRPEQVGARNKAGGLMMLCPYFGWPEAGHGELSSETVRSLLVNGFADRYCGHRVLGMIGETAGTCILNVTKRFGCKVINSYPEWTPNPILEKLDLLPCLVGLSKEDTFGTENYWLHKMFTYFPPRFFFTHAQQLVLVRARLGLTDAEIGADLGITADAVKKRWSGIYQRVESVMPDLLPKRASKTRGSEKRRALVTYLADRPEELRPYG